MDTTQIDIICQFLQITGTNEEKLVWASKLLGKDEQAMTGIEELRYLLTHAPAANLVVDFTLARGLNYYTGLIFLRYAHRLLLKWVALAEEAGTMT